MGMLAAGAGGSELDAIVDPIDPGVPRWVSLIVVSGPEDAPVFHEYHYRDSRDSVAFWPASTVKIYTAVHALERLNELEMPFDTTLIFEHRDGDRWVLDAARTMKEMLSEVFRRSSNEDYTLLLRFCGIDGINTRFLIPERGFPHSALMRGYVLGRPYEYVRKEPQRITLLAGDGRRRTVEHEWSGRSYSRERGATVISETTGNCTSTAELAECMRRIMFHEFLPEAQKYRLTREQAEFLREGADGLHGMRSEEGYSWYQAIDGVFPEARYYRKGGMIEGYYLDVACIRDDASGVGFVLAVATKSDSAETLKKIATAVAERIRDGGFSSGASSSGSE